MKVDRRKKRGEGARAIIHIRQAVEVGIDIGEDGSQGVTPLDWILDEIGGKIHAQRDMVLCRDERGAMWCAQLTHS